MLKVHSSATIHEIKKASKEYLKLIDYKSCNERGKENYNYMQGVHDAIQIVERELNVKF